MVWGQSWQMQSLKLMMNLVCFTRLVHKATFELNKKKLYLGNSVWNIYFNYSIAILKISWLHIQNLILFFHIHFSNNKLITLVLSHIDLFLSNEKDSINCGRKPFNFELSIKTLESFKPGSFGSTCMWNQRIWKLRKYSYFYFG